MLRRSPHYYPILRLKRGEIRGIREIDQVIDMHHTLVFEVLPEHFWADKKDEQGKEIKGQKIQRDTEQVIQEKAELIQGNCNNSRPIMMDFGRLTDEIRNTSQTHPLSLFYSKTRVYKLTIIPVTGIVSSMYPADYQKAVAECVSAGCKNVCLRVKSSDLELNDIENQIASVLDGWGLTHNAVYFLLDMGHVNETINLSEIISKIPDLQRWGKFILAAGAYPEDETMSNLRPGSHNPLRYDLINWQDLALDENYTGRMPDFSDYGIRGSQYNEYIQSKNFPAAKVTWSLPERWAVEKGVPTDQKSDQFVPLGRALEGYDDLPESLMDDCVADQILRQVFDEDTSLSPEIKLNNFEGWICLGTDRHITLTVRQLLKMFDQ